MSGKWQHIFERKAKNVQIFNRPLLLGRLGDLNHVLVTWSVVSGGGCVRDRGQRTESGGQLTVDRD